MKNIEYYLKTPKKFIKKQNQLKPLQNGQALIRPLVTGICGSDVHYYLGLKSPEKLKERLPVILLHEGVAEIVEVKGKTGLKKGDRVIVIPFEACGKCNACKNGDVNLCPKSKYMGSTAPGLAREYLVYPAKKLVKVSKEISNELAALIEPLTITYHSFKNVTIKKTDKVLIMGEGPMGFLLAMVLSHFGEIPKSNLYISGMFDKKLKLVQDFCQTYNITKEKQNEKLNQLKKHFDYIFECVGGGAMRLTVNQALDLLKPKGTLVLLGITDEQIPVNMNKVVNNGLIIKGSSRSVDQDYQVLLRLMKNSKVQSLLKRLINPKKVKITNIQDLYRGFELASDKSQIGRIMLYW